MRFDQAVRISVLGAVLVLAEDEASGIAVICQQSELKASAHGWGTVDVVGRETTARLLVPPGSDGGAWHSLLAQPLLNDFVVVAVNDGLDTPESDKRCVDSVIVCKFLNTAS